MTEEACGDRAGTPTGHVRHRRARQRPCEPCRQSHNHQTRELHRAARARGGLANNDPRHGTPAGYKAGCNLSCCRTAVAKAAARAPHRRPSPTRVPATRDAGHTRRDGSSQVPEELARVLRDMRARRDPKLNSVLHLAYRKGWQYVALAEALGVSKQAVKLRVDRAEGVITAGMPPVPMPPPVHAPRRCAWCEGPIPATVRSNIIYCTVACRKARQHQVRMARAKARVATCAGCGCERPHHGRGLCSACYTRVRRHGG